MVSARRSLGSYTTSDSWETLEPLVPYSSYFVQVNASNSKGFILSNNIKLDMPRGREHQTVFCS